MVILSKVLNVIWRTLTGSDWPDARGFPMVKIMDIVRDGKSPDQFLFIDLLGRPWIARNANDKRRWSVPEVEELAESLSETFGLEEVAKNGIPEPYRTVIEKIVFG